NAVDVMALLSEREEIADRTKIGVVLDCQREILAKVSRKACVRGERDLAVLAEAYIDDRIDDEIPVTFAPADDGADFHAPACVGKLRHQIIVFEIETNPELALRCIGRGEQSAKLHRIGMIAIAVDRPRNVESSLKPIGDTVGEFGGRIERVV